MSLALRQVLAIFAFLRKRGRAEAKLYLQLGVWFTIIFHGVSTSFRRSASQLRTLQPGEPLDGHVPDVLRGSTPSPLRSGRSSTSTYSYGAPTGDLGAGRDRAGVHRRGCLLSASQKPRGLTIGTGACPAICRRSRSPVTRKSALPPRPLPESERRPDHRARSRAAWPRQLRPPHGAGILRWLRSCRRGRRTCHRAPDAAHKGPCRSPPGSGPRYPGHCPPPYTLNRTFSSFAVGHHIVLPLPHANGPLP